MGPTLLVLFVLSAATSVSALQLVNVSVPRYAELHATVTMSCYFELGDGRLYTVKWYKDDHEFFSYSPASESKGHSLPGVTLDMSRSNINQVTLMDVRFISSGVYRCEVSTEGPNFETLFSNENMTVRALPSGNPVIRNLQPAYSPGDVIEANCTSPRSKPVPNLAWYLNGMRVDRFSLVYYANNEDEDGLSETVLGLNARAEVTLFPGGGVLELRCTAQIQERTWATTATTMLARLNNQKLAQDEFTSAADRVFVSLVLVLASSLLNWCW